ncbi:16S rRNA (cytosine(967)-C(5))-methyltransferase RsmB [Gemmata sp.]|uniref:16S rRNA (cytosine(967)-C(5))-methyltransferase RsmB n=1 Tax=Gemmata sp. TaxID=1914242 RepID=UPI003F706A88
MTITARQIAADVLHRSRSHDAFAAELIDNAVAAASITPQDRRFLTQLVYGVIRRKGTLDALLRPYMKIPFHAIEPRVWDALHLGAFQLAFLTGVPTHAAVHETVELANHIGSPKAKGFLNSILRRVSELVTGDFTDKPDGNAVPMDDGRYRVLARPILPAPGTDPAGYFAAAFSFPKWLADQWHQRFDPDECRRLGFWFNAPPPLWVRVNKLHNARETYRLRLAAQMIDAEPGEHPQSLRFPEHHPIRGLPGYDDGDFAVQDHSSMLVASALGLQPGMRVLDLCAAPGGKTTHLAELMDNRGFITACDTEPRRLETVTTLCQRLRIKGVRTVLLGPDGESPPGPFDAALVDVPCSNTGVLGRRPEVRWRLKPTEFQYLIRLQTRLLFQALDRVKSGGLVVYSTCSIEPDENEGVVKAVMRGIRNLRLEAEHRAVPGRPSDGGYWARLRKG